MSQEQSTQSNQSQSPPSSYSLDRESIQFDKLSQGIYAINYNIKSYNYRYSKEQILFLLEKENRRALRDASRYFYNVSGEYRRIIHYFSSLLTFDYLIIPRMNGIKFDSAFQKNYQKVLDYTDNSYIQEQSRFIAYTILLDGIFYGYERVMNGNYVLQQLPYEYCRTNYKINGLNAIEFNFSFFDQYRDPNILFSILNSFPPEFTKLYNAYKNGETMNWVILDPTYSRCHKLTDNMTPFFSGVFPKLVNLQDYEELDVTKNKMDLYRLIVQKIPTDKASGLPLLKLDEAQALHSNTKKMITQEGIDVVTTPLEVVSINLQEKGQTLRDNIERATNGVYNAIGSSKILFNSGSDGGSIGLGNSIKTDEAVMFDLLSQFSRYYENRFSNIVSNYKHLFEMMFPPLTIFNREEMFDKYKESATLGYSKLLPMIALGIKQSTVNNLMDFENDYLKLLDKLKPLQTSHTLSSSPTDNQPGRKPKKESKLTEKGLETKNNDANANRAK